MLVLQFYFLYIFYVICFYIFLIGFVFYSKVIVIFYSKKRFASEKTFSINRRFLLIQET